MTKNNSGRYASVIVAAHDDTLLRKICEHSQHLCVAAAVCTAEESYTAVDQHKPDVALIAAVLADGPTAGLAVIRRLRAANLPIRPVLALDHREPDLVLEAFAAGAKGVVYSSEPIEAICDALHQVRCGKLRARSEDLELVFEAAATRHVPVA